MLFYVHIVGNRELSSNPTEYLGYRNIKISNGRCFFDFCLFTDLILNTVYRRGHLTIRKAYSAWKVYREQRQNLFHHSGSYPMRTD